MKGRPTKKDKWIMLRVSAEELQKIRDFSRATTCRSTSSYARLVLLKKPVTVTYRNRSVDDLLHVMVGLKNELGAIGNNFNEAVHRLNTLERVPEIRQWLLQSEALRQNFMQKEEQIRQTMIQIYDQWSQR